MADITNRQQAAYILAGLAAAHRAAQIATSPENTSATNTDPALSEANGVMAQTLAEYQEAIAEGQGSICLPYPGEGNGRRMYDIDNAEWGDPC